MRATHSLEPWLLLISCHAFQATHPCSESVGICEDMLGYWTAIEMKEIDTMYCARNESARIWHHTNTTLLLPHEIPSYARKMNPACCKSIKHFIISEYLKREVVSKHPAWRPLSTHASSNATHSCHLCLQTTCCEGQSAATLKSLTLIDKRGKNG